jgi:hypothetical protein
LGSFEFLWRILSRLPLELERRERECVICIKI